MIKSRFSVLMIISIFMVTSIRAFAQMDDLHGDNIYHKNGVHAGNQFRTTFYNDGTWGRINNPPDIGGEWPINSGHLYWLGGILFVGSEVIDANNELKHITSTVRGPGNSWSKGDQGPNGEWYTFLPLPGFANPDTDKVAMSKWPWAWPQRWPDKYDDPVDPGWAGQWNGYFGKDIFNADEESYFVADDYQNKEWNFYPDSTDLTRGGLGLRLYCRGFQWSNVLVEDAIFVLLDLENIGTHEHDKMVFGFKMGNNMGDTESGYDSNDDCGGFDKDKDVAYLYDYDDLGYGNWTPVGYFGGAFLESPGNPYDGIDNDNDGCLGTGPTISTELFARKTLSRNDPIVLIDYSTFKRTVTTLGDTLDKLGTDVLTVHYQDRVFEFRDGQEIDEYPNDLVDNNLNGLIDENNGSVLGDPPHQITRYLYIDNGIGYKYVNYFTGEGSDNPLIDEKRDDGIDNDHDWNILTDDLGADGAPFTGDPGEGDGKPTYGETHFDKTDIDETDMLGLTSFTLYRWEDIPHWEDQIIWDNIRPGFFDDRMENDNVELLYGSGYFPLIPEQIERFSMGVMCGINFDDFLENTKWVARAYHENYNFSRAPYIPTVKAVAGDGVVTLFWDDFAEKSVDPISGEDFEGYRIYRSTNARWEDMVPITDGIGSQAYLKPLAQFDIVNEYAGYAAIPIKGIHFHLGNNTGLVHSWADTTVKNGFTYYYAVTSYDHGYPEGLIPPTECAKFISVGADGKVEDKGTNIVIVRPEAAAAGYQEADFDSSKITPLPGNTTTAFLDYEILIPRDIKDGHQYRVEFQDTLTKDLLRATKNFTLTDVTDNVVVLKECELFHAEDEVPIVDGFKLSFKNNPEILRFKEGDSGWNRGGVYEPQVRVFEISGQETFLQSADFKIVIGEMGIDTSTAFVRRTNELPAIPVNFAVYNTTINKKAKFAFYERDELEGETGKFTAFTEGVRSDEIYILTDFDSGYVAGWQISLSRVAEDSLQPEPGDELVLNFYKPFLSHDVFEFTVRGASIDPELAKEQMDHIRVVPNPYIVTNSWEPENPYASGRGPRELHFTHLPKKCTIKIFNLRGQLVNTLEHDSELSDGTEIWDMLTKDYLDISYGIYIYYVDAEAIGEKLGKFAVIK